MKNKILTGVLLCTLFSCSPKIVLNKIQEYPSLSQEDTIMIVNEGEKVPVAATLIGQVAILDRSFTIRCRYDQVLKIAKEETRKAGGDILQITDHLLPGVASSCHQISGNILKSGISDSTYNTQTTFYNYSVNNVLNKVRPLPPRVDFSFNVGYGWLPKTEGLTGTDKQFDDKLTSGLAWDLAFHHYIKNFGWVIFYSGYSSDSYYEKTNMDHNVLFSYIAPLFCTKYSFNKKWMINGEVGVGYLKFSDKISSGIEKGKTYVSTVGFNYGIGIEYKLNKHMGIGISFNEIVGSAFLKNIKMENVHSIIAYNDYDRINLNRFNLLGGIRFYFGDR